MKRLRAIVIQKDGSFDVFNVSLASFNDDGSIHHILYKDETGIHRLAKDNEVILRYEEN